MAYAAIRSDTGATGSLGILFAALARAAERCMHDFKPQEIANTAWAFVIADESDAPLFMALARTAEWHMCKFKPQEIANTVWALQTAGLSDAKLLKAFANVVDFEGFNA